MVIWLMSVGSVPVRKNMEIKNLAKNQRIMTYCRIHKQNKLVRYCLFT